MEGLLPSSSSSPEEEKRSERRLPPPPRAAPWLVIPHGKGRKYQAFYNLCQPENRTCRKFIPEISRKSYWQKPSHQGWLVMLCDDHKAEYPILPNRNYGDCFLWNPLTLETIQLPSLLHWLTNKSDQYWIFNCVLTSSPTNPRDESLVLFLMKPFDRENDEYVLVFCRLGENKKWRTKVLPRHFLSETIVLSLLCFQRKVYVMCINSTHLELEIQLGHDDDDDEIVTIRPFEIICDFPVIAGVAASDAEAYYVESCNELFMVDVYSNKPREKRNLLASILVYRLDVSLMAWEKVKSLGDHVLFVSKNATASCSAAELGLPRGCLYYTMPEEDQSLYKIEVEDNSITPILPCLKLPTPWFSAGWIMMPTTVRMITDGRRRIEDMLCEDKEQDNFVMVEKNKASLVLSDDKDLQDQKQNEGEAEEARSWCSLNMDMMQLIASYLHPVDYGCFRATCKANRMMIPARYQRSSFGEIIPTINFSPWLVFSADDDTIYNFIDPMHNNERYLMNLPEFLLGASIRFSKGGWLLMSKGLKTLFFYNPFTREIIQLPDLYDHIHCSGMSFSSTPTSSDCVVFGIRCMFSDQISIFVVARGNDTWTDLEFENRNPQKFVPCVNNPVFYDGAFYCLDYSGTLGVFDPENGFTWKVLAYPLGPFGDDYPSFLIKCDGELLLVDLGHLGKSIGIFRLDFSKMAWVKVKTLGKHMLFISNTSSFSAVAPHSRMENKIYFPRLHGEGILFYSLDTGKFHSVGSQNFATNFYDTKEWFSSTWIEPNWSQTTEQELYWLSI